MKKFFLSALCAVAFLVAGCAKEVPPVEETMTVQTEPHSDVTVTELPDGEYTAVFDTDSSMFHVNEAHEGKGILTVEDGKMTIHISLASKNIQNLYPGLAADAAGDEANILQPTMDSVTYKDGYTEIVHGFDVPVPYLEEEFDLALIGKKEKWYDHKVRVSSPEYYVKECIVTCIDVAPGDYLAELTLEGGSGRAAITSPTKVKVGTEGAPMAVITWSSPNYDYMIVDGEKYLPVNTEGNSVFEIPLMDWDTPITVIADTVAMSSPKEITYTITAHSDTLVKEQ